MKSNILPADAATRRLVIQTALLTLIVVGTILRATQPFLHHPLDSLYSDMERHYHNALDVYGGDIENICNAPGLEIFLSAVLRITSNNRFLISLVFSALSAVTPWLWYRWFRELTRDKTVSLFGYVLMAFLPSWFRIFSYFMDSIILLPLTGAGLWLTWRAARKGTWSACLLGALFCGAACTVKSVALPIVTLPWLYVGYTLFRRSRKLQSLAMAGTAMFIVCCSYGLGPLKVWSHTGAIVLLPDGIYNQRYFESGARDITVTNYYNRPNEGTWVATGIWGSSSVCYPAFYPFSNWMGKRTGSYIMDIDYRRGWDATKPLQMSLLNRLYYTFENIIFFFFEMQWPEDNDFADPHAAHYFLLARFLWFPLTIGILACMIRTRSRDFVGFYFVAVTLVFMLQQSAVMEGRYKKVWEGLPIGTALFYVSRSKRYRKLMERDWQPACSDAFAMPVRSDASTEATAASVPAV